MDVSFLRRIVKNGYMLLKTATEKKDITVAEMMTELDLPPMTEELLVAMVDELMSLRAKKSFSFLQNISSPHCLLPLFLEDFLFKLHLSGWSMDRPLDLERFRIELRQLENTAPTPSQSFMANLDLFPW